VGAENEELLGYLLGVQPDKHARRALVASRGQEGYTALEWACVWGRHRSLRLLLSEESIQREEPDLPSRLLQLAVKSGDVDTVEMVITLDEDVILKNSETCLSWALGQYSPAWMRQTATVQIVALLLSRGANPNAPMARHLLLLAFSLAPTLSSPHSSQTAAGDSLLSLFCHYLRFPLTEIRQKATSAILHWICEKSAQTDESKYQALARAAGQYRYDDDREFEMGETRLMNSWWRPDLRVAEEEMEEEEEEEEYDEYARPHEPGGRDIAAASL
jgi:hypothetical protein